MATIKPPRKEPNLALLIDAETIAPRYISFITARILGRHGNPLLRRVYGDWASPRMCRLVRSRAGRPCDDDSQPRQMLRRLGCEGSNGSICCRM